MNGRHSLAPVTDGGVVELIKTKKDSIRNQALKELPRVAVSVLVDSFDVVRRLEYFLE